MAGKHLVALAQKKVYIKGISRGSPHQPARSLSAVFEGQLIKALLATPSPTVPMAEETAPFPGRNFQPASNAEVACAELRRVALALHVTLPPDPLCEDLQAAVERAAQRSADSMNALRVAVEQFTAALRDDGLKAEGVLISLKSVINSRTFSVTRAYAGQHDDDLRQQISTWSIKEFYREL